MFSLRSLRALRLLSFGVRLWVMAALAAVVFDFDGIILDSETAEFESHRRIYERCGVPLTPREWCDQIGIWVESDEDRWSVRLAELSSSAPDPAAFKAEQHRLFREILAREPMRGIRELLDALQAARVPTAIASTAPSRWVASAVAELALSDYFQTIVTADDVRRRKPAPDAYLEATRRLGADPARSVAVGESRPRIRPAPGGGGENGADSPRATGGPRPLRSAARGLPHR